MPRGSFVSAACAERQENRDDLMSLLANMSMGQWVIAVLMIGICGLLMLVILLQKGRGGGLAGAFGGGGGGSSAFGAKTGDVFTWITVVVACLFLVLNVVANFAFDQSPTVATQTFDQAEDQPGQLSDSPGGGRPSP